MFQDRLSSISTLSIEYELARTLDYTEIIDNLAKKKGRRALIH